MSQFLFLTERMERGFGVSVAVHELSERLVRRGHRVTVGCLNADESSERSYEVARLRGDGEAGVLSLAAGRQAEVIVAHTSPFLELLPFLTGYRTWAWEYGDPTPELFEAPESRDRERIRRHKIESCYPAADGVIAISEFIRRDIEWPAAHVLSLGCDHAPDFASKGLREVDPRSERPLKVGGLMRLGRGEARYKGTALFLRLAEDLKSAGVSIDLSIMGRGTKVDAAKFREAGWRVWLNATEGEKWDYLRGLDVFVSCSLWEGFDFPLVEAQAVGTLGLALDTGAHPETCPFIFPNANELGRFLSELAKNRSLILEHSLAAYRFVRSRFEWNRVVADFEELVASRAADRTYPLRLAPIARQAAEKLSWRDSVARDWAAFVRSLRYEGVLATLRKIPVRLRSMAEHR